MSASQDAVSAKAAARPPEKTPAPAARGPGAAGDLAIGANGIEPRHAAHDELGNDQRQPKAQNTDQIEQQEGAAAVGTGHVRKFPDVAQADRRAGSGHDETEARGPVVALHR